MLCNNEVLKFKRNYACIDIDSSRDACIKCSPSILLLGMKVDNGEILAVLH